MIEAKDQYGRQIKIGDVITYPGRQGSSLWMNTAVVYDIVEQSSWSRKTYPVLKVKRTQRWCWRHEEPKVQKVSLTNVSLTTVVDEAALHTNNKLTPLIEVYKELNGG